MKSVVFSYQVLGVSRSLRALRAKRRGARTKAIVAALHSLLWTWKLNSVLPSNAQKMYPQLAESINCAARSSCWQRQAMETCTDSGNSRCCRELFGKTRQVRPLFPMAQPAKAI